MQKYYTYAYLREDRTPYYIGKGQKNRAFHKGSRRLTPPPKERILFLKQNLTEEEAFRHEIYMISVFGRIDLGTGILRNLTDGGEGSSGYKLTQEQIQKIKISKSGKPTWNKGKITKEKVSYSGEYMREYRNGKKRIDKNRLFFSPEGEKILITDLKLFCKENNLTYQSMLKVQREINSHHRGYQKAQISSKSQ